MKTYTICVFTENSIGLLNKITIIFTRRRLNIESLTVSETERKGVSRFTIVIKHDQREAVEKLVRQIRKVVEVLAVFGYLNEDIVYNEIAMFKIPTPLDSTPLDMETINRVHKAYLVYWGLDYMVLQKTGTEEEIFDFFKYIKPFGILEFIRSGRIAVGKTPKGLVEYLPEDTEWEYLV
ncbi:acetolactate synthase small subunit [Arcticibacterium luteifluviistationis]|uniref:Acetolactate synthase small subunit n=1 Tax=Arcticibacterium luteifluviistationis TaxID=1784714 RepID=A0A2Z4GFX8_9BACT|nr:acetolactate synthase small subunit [Arcticibacterium luteifluviistationis]AWV99898.1 acetolactate synthase small subunit [Arcticibacterium luteifluviistationis]